MGSVSERLKAEAAVRTKDVLVGKEHFTVTEIGAEDFTEYGRLLKLTPADGGGRQEATAFLLSRCVLEDGALALSMEDARVVAKSTRVALPLVSAIMELSGFGDDEKKADAS